MRKEELRLDRAVVPDGDADMFAKGQRLDDNVVAAFARGLVPGEALQISGEAVANGPRIRKDLQALWADHSDFAALRASFGQEGEVKTALERISLPTELVLYMTVMRSAERHTYDKAVVGMWLSLLMGLDLALDRSEIDVLTKAALLRDVGMLYAPQELLSPKSQLRLDRQLRIGMERHVEVGAEVIRRAGASFGKVADLVRVHHERVDGSGYPDGLAGLDLSPSARVLGMCDMAVAIRMRPNLHADVELLDVPAVMNMDRHGLCPVIYPRLLKRIEASRAHLDGRRAEARHAAQLGIRCQYLSELVVELRDRIRPRNRPGVDMVAVRKRAERTFRLVQQSGLTDRELAWWLKRVANGREPATPEQLKEIEMQQNELLRQIERLDSEIGSTLSFAEDHLRSSGT